MGHIEVRGVQRVEHVYVSPISHDTVSMGDMKVSAHLVHLQITCNQPNKRKNIKTNKQTNDASMYLSDVFNMYAHVVSDLYGHHRDMWTHIPGCTHY